MKKLVIIFIALFGFSVFSYSRLDQLAHAFDLLKMEKMSPYEFGLQAVDYWEDERNLGNISDQKYCLEVDGVRKVIKTESRREESPEKNIEKFNSYLTRVLNFDHFCKKVKQNLTSKN